MHQMKKLIRLGFACGCTFTLIGCNADTPQDFELKKNNIETFTFTQYKGAEYYKVVDDNDYKSDEAKTYYAKDGKSFTYTVDFQGDHNVYVEAYDKDNKLLKVSNTCQTYIEPVYFYQSFNNVIRTTVYELKQLGVSDEIIDKAEIIKEDEDPLRVVKRVYVDKDLKWTAKAKEQLKAYDKDYLKLIKDAGANLLMFEGDSGMIKEDEYEYEGSYIEQYLNDAYELGLKVSLSLESVQSVFFSIHRDQRSYKTYEEFCAEFGNRLANQFNTDIVLKAFTHPCVAAFTMGDEPNINGMNNVKYLVQWIKEFFASKNLTLPTILCDLVPFHEPFFGKYDEGGKEAYIKYMEDWNEIIGQNVIEFDMYTHNENGSYSHNEQDRWTYEAIQEFRRKHPQVVIHQTIGCSRSNSMTGSMSYKDFYSQMYLTVAQEFKGVSWFSFNPITDGGWIHAPVWPSSTGGAIINNHYYDIKEANKQRIELLNLLEGYTYDDSEMTFNKIIDEYDPSEGIDFHITQRGFKSTLKNGEDIVTMYVNNGTTDDVPFEVVIPSGKTYYYCSYKGIDKFETVNETTLYIPNATSVIVFD